VICGALAAGISAGAGWAAVALGFLERVLGAVLVAQRVCLFGLCVVRQKTFDGVVPGVRGGNRDAGSLG